MIMVAIELAGDALGLQWVQNAEMSKLKRLPPPRQTPSSSNSETRIPMRAVTAWDYLGTPLVLDTPIVYRKGLFTAEFNFPIGLSQYDDLPPLICNPRSALLLALQYISKLFNISARVDTDVIRKAAAEEQELPTIIAHNFDVEVTIEGKKEGEIKVLRITHTLVKEEQEQIRATILVPLLHNTPLLSRHVPVSLEQPLRKNLPCWDIDQPTASSDHADTYLLSFHFQTNYWLMLASLSYPETFGHTLPALWTTKLPPKAKPTIPPSISPQITWEVVQAYHITRKWQMLLPSPLHRYLVNRLAAQLLLSSTESREDFTNALSMIAPPSWVQAQQNLPWPTRHRTPCRRIDPYDLYPNLATFSVSFAHCARFLKAVCEEQHLTFLQYTVAEWLETPSDSLEQRFLHYVDHFVRETLSIQRQTLPNAANVQVDMGILSSPFDGPLPTFFPQYRSIFQMLRYFRIYRFPKIGPLSPWQNEEGTNRRNK